MPEYFDPFTLSYGVFVGDWLLARREISGNAKLLYGRLVRHLGKAAKICNPRHSVLAQELGFSERHIRNLIAELEENNLIEVTQNGLRRANSYKFLLHPWVKEALSGDQADRNDSSGQEPSDRNDSAGPDRNDSAGQGRNDSAGPDRNDRAGPYKKIVNKKIVNRRSSIEDPSSSYTLVSDEAHDQPEGARKDRLLIDDPNDHTDPSLNGSPFGGEPDGGATDQQGINQQETVVAVTYVVGRQSNQTRVSDLDLFKLKQVSAASHGRPANRFHWSAVEEALLRESIRSFGLAEAAVLVENLPMYSRDGADYHVAFFRSVLEQLCEKGESPSQWLARKSGRAPDGQPLGPRTSLTERRPGIPTYEEVMRPSITRRRVGDLD